MAAPVLGRAAAWAAAIGGITHAEAITMLAAIFSAIRMILGLVLDIVTLPFRILFALFSGAEFEFRRFSRPRA